MCWNSFRLFARIRCQIIAGGSHKGLSGHCHGTKIDAENPLIMVYLYDVLPNERPVFRPLAHGVGSDELMGHLKEISAGLGHGRHFADDFLFPNPNLDIFICKNGTKIVDRHI
jgi:hypothetical protein